MMNRGSISPRVLKVCVFLSVAVMLLFTQAAQATTRILWVTKYKDPRGGALSILRISSRIYSSKPHYFKFELFLI